jgi:hypothetical protein
MKGEAMCMNTKCKDFAVSVEIVVDGPPPEGKDHYDLKCRQCDEPLTGWIDPAL